MIRFVSCQHVDDILKHVDLSGGSVAKTELLVQVAQVQSLDSRFYMPQLKDPICLIQDQ